MINVLPATELEKGMRAALAAAREWLGNTSPNPAVGAAALDKNGHIIAVGAHKRAGTAHAEAGLIADCRAKGLLEKIHTLCITLEPCNHFGHTPPCAEAVVASGIKNVAIGTHDPNPQVKGGGLQRLLDAGIQVTENVEGDACRQLLHSFAHKVITGLSWISIKSAIDQNGSMIPPPGAKTFTNPSSLVFAHRLRKVSDAILTGSGTVLAHDPHFTVRRVQDFADKKRMLAILDRRRRVTSAYLQAARSRGFEPIIYDDLDFALRDLAQRQVNNILVEAGPSLTYTILSSPHWCAHAEIHHHTNGEDVISTKLNPKFSHNQWKSWHWENALANENSSNTI